MARWVNAQSCAVEDNRKMHDRDSPGTSSSATLDQSTASSIYHLSAARMTRGLHDGSVAPPSSPSVSIHLEAATSTVQQAPLSLSSRDILTSRQQKASEPFNVQSADTILRSVDDVNFYVHGVIISLASPWFKDRLRQEWTRQAEEKPADQSPQLIFVSESSVVLDRLLRLCYPVEAPTITNCMDLTDVAEAAVKYGMTGAVQALRNQLVLCMAADPFAVFAASMRLGYEEVALQSARIIQTITRRASLSDFFVNEMRQLTAGQYYRLLRYCADPHALTSTLFYKDLRPMTRENVIQHPISIPPQFGIASGGDMLLTSSDGIQFCVVQAFISLASELPLCSWPRSRADLCPSLGPRTIFLCEKGDIMSCMLQLIYPLREPDITDLGILRALYDAGVSYCMPKVTDFVQRKLLERVDTDPLEVFLTASRHKWVHGAREAAKQAIYTEFDFYLPEMELVPANAYHDFLQYRLRCRRALYPSSLGGKLCTTNHSSQMGLQSHGSDAYFWRESGDQQEGAQVMMLARPPSSSKEIFDTYNSVLYKRWTMRMAGLPHTRVHNEIALDNACNDAKVLLETLRQKIAKIPLNLTM